MASKGSFPSMSAKPKASRHRTVTRTLWVGVDDPMPIEEVMEPNSLAVRLECSVHVSFCEHLQDAYRKMLDAPLLEGATAASLRVMVDVQPSIGFVVVCLLEPVDDMFFNATAYFHEDPKRGGPVWEDLGLFDRNDGRHALRDVILDRASTFKKTRSCKSKIHPFGESRQASTLLDAWNLVANGDLCSHCYSYVDATEDVPNPF